MIKEQLQNLIGIFHNSFWRCHANLMSCLFHSFKLEHLWGYIFKNSASSVHTKITNFEQIRDLKTDILTKFSRM